MKQKSIQPGFSIIGAAFLGLVSALCIRPDNKSSTPFVWMLVSGGGATAYWVSSLVIIKKKEEEEEVEPQYLQHPQLGDIRLELGQETQQFLNNMYNSRTQNVLPPAISTTAAPLKLEECEKLEPALKHKVDVPDDQPLTPARQQSYLEEDVWGGGGGNKV